MRRSLIASLAAGSVAVLAAAVRFAPDCAFLGIPAGLVPFARIYGAGILLVVLVAALVEYALSDRSIDVDRAGRLFLSMCVLIPISCFAIAELKYYNLRMYADMANNLEIMWRATHGFGMTSPMFARSHTGLHWFAAHFAPVSYVLAQPFRLLPGPEYLNALMAFVIPSAAIPVYLYARDILGPKGAIWVAISVLLYPTIQFLGIYDFGFLQLCIPVLGWAFFASHRGWLWRFVGLCILAVLIREEVGITVFMLGLFSARYHRTRWVGVAVALGAIAYSICAITVFIPSFRSGPGLLYLSHYGVFGDSVRDVALNLMRRPWIALPVIFTPIKVANAAMYLLPLMLTPLLGFPIVAIAAINVLTSFLAAPLTIYSFMLYYLSPTVPFLFMASILGIERLRHRRILVRPEVSMAACALACSVLFGPTPISLSFWVKEYKLGEFHSTNFHRSNYTDFAHSRTGRRIARLVPKDAVVSAEQAYLPLLYDRRKALIFPELPEETQYVLIDRKHPYKAGFLDTYEDFRNRPEFYYARLTPDAWAEVESDDGVVLFRRR